MKVDKAEASQEQTRDLLESQKRLNTELEEARRTAQRYMAANLKLEKELKEAKAAEVKAQEEAKILNEALEAERHARAEELKRIEEEGVKIMERWAASAAATREELSSIFE